MYTLHFNTTHYQRSTAYRSAACFDAVPGVRQALTEYPTGQRGLGGTSSDGGSALLRMGTCSAHASRIVRQACSSRPQSSTVSMRASTVARGGGVPGDSSGSSSVPELRGDLRGELRGGGGALPAATSGSGGLSKVWQLPEVARHSARSSISPHAPPAPMTSCSTVGLGPEAPPTPHIKWRLRPLHSKACATYAAAAPAPPAPPAPLALPAPPAPPGPPDLPESAMRRVSPSP